MTLLRAPVGLVISFLVTPFLVHRLGVGQYGSWTVLNSFLAYVVMLDIGLSVATARFVADATGRSDVNAIGQIVGGSLVVYGTVAVTGCMVLGTLSGKLMGLIGLGPLGVRLLRLMLLGVVLDFLRRPFEGVLVGIQRLDLASLIAMMGQMLAAGAAVFVIFHDWGVSGLAVAYVSVAGITLFVTVMVSLRVHRGLQRIRLGCKWLVVKEIVAFSVRVGLGQIAGVVGDQLPKTVLAVSGDLVGVSYYQLGNRLFATARSVPQMILPAITAGAAELHGAGRKDDVRKLYLRSIRYVMTLSTAIAGVLVLSVRPFVERWLGPGFTDVAVIVWLMVPGLLAIAPVGPGVNSLTGAGRPEVGARLSLVVSTVNLVLVVVGVELAGFWGAIVGASVAFTVGWGGGHFYVAKCLGVRYVDTLREMGRPVLAMLLAMAVTVWGFTQDAGQYVSMAAWAGVYLASFGAFWLFGPGADADDRRMIRQLAPRWFGGNG